MRDVPVYIEAVGQTRGHEEIEISARVEGFLETMNFKEGTFVKKGQVLYTIDARPFRASLAQAHDATLIDVQLPLAEGLVDRLRSGIDVADLGCGSGHAINLMAKAFPKSQFIGYDYHEPSIVTAQQRAKEAGAGNVQFEVAEATSYSGKDFDLIAFFDCLHDMADPASRSTCA